MMDATIHMMDTRTSTMIRKLRAANRPLVVRPCRLKKQQLG